MNQWSWVFFSHVAPNCHHQQLCLRGGKRKTETNIKERVKIIKGTSTQKMKWLKREGIWLSHVHGITCFYVLWCKNIWCTWKALSGMPRVRWQDGSMAASFGRFAGCHGHAEGNVPVSRRWVQWHKRDALPLLYATHSQHLHTEGSRACWRAQSHAHINISLCCLKHCTKE